MKNILVTGGNGQLGLSIKSLSKNLSNYNFIFSDLSELDITNPDNVNGFFKNNKIEYCVNCAAYTNVDKAESEIETAKKVNLNGVYHIAVACKAYDVKLIHISTDFVFDGQQSTPYQESDKKNPLGNYGETKLQAELAVTKTLNEFFVLRTSWLYSEYGNNFLKTMLRLANEKDNISVVYDQVGTPTYAKDLASVIIKIIVDKSKSYGVYNYSNEGVASWYDFAMAIFDETKTKIKVLPIKSAAYPTPVKRPAYSVLDKQKIKTNLGLDIPYWRHSLKVCIKNISK